MAAGTVREFVSTWGFDVNTKPIIEAEQSISQLKSKIKETVLTIGEWTAALFAVAAITAEYGHEAQEAADRLNMNVQEYQAYQRAAQMAGVEQERFNMGMTLMTRQAAEASMGNMQAAETFARLGVSVRDANGHVKEGGTLLREVADGLIGVKDKAARLSIATELFGARNSRMLSFLNEGSEGIGKFIKEGEKFNFVMGDEAIKASDEFHQSLEKTKFVLYGIRNTLGVELMPVFRKYLELFMKWVEANQKLIKSGLKEFVSAVAQIFEAIWIIAKPFLAFFQALASVPGLIYSIVIALSSLFMIMGYLKFAFAAFKFGAWLASLPGAITAIGSAWTWLSGLLSGSILVMLAGLTSIFAIFQDIFYFLTGQRSALGTIIKNFTYLLDPYVEFFRTMWKNLSSMQGLANMVFHPFKTMGGAVHDAFVGPTAHVLAGAGGTNMSSRQTNHINVAVQGGATNAETGTVVADHIENRLAHVNRQTARAHDDRVEK